MLTHTLKFLLAQLFEKFIILCQRLFNKNMLKTKNKIKNMKKNIAV